MRVCEGKVVILHEGVRGKVVMLDEGVRGKVVMLMRV